MMDSSQQYLAGFLPQQQQQFSYVLDMDHQVADLFLAAQQQQQQQQYATDSSSQSSPGIDFAGMESTGTEEELQYLIHADRGVFDQLDIFGGQQQQQQQQQQQLTSFGTLLGDHELPDLDELVQVSSGEGGSSSSHDEEQRYIKAHTSSSGTSSSSDADVYKASSDATSVMQQQAIQPQQPDRGWAHRFPDVGFASSAGFAPEANLHASGSNNMKSEQQVCSPRPPPPPPPQQPQHGGMATMRETLYRMAIWRPITAADCLGGSKPKRRNVRISSDPQTVAARHRRERISTKIRILQRLVPGGTKMDTASMLDEAIHYVKYLKSQVQAMELLEQSSSESLLRSSSSATSSASTSTASAASASASASQSAAAAAAASAAGFCHLYNPHSGSGLLNGSIFWPQQFSMDSSSAGGGAGGGAGLVVQQVNISGY